MISPSDIREILFNVSKNIILPSFGNLSEKQISYKNGLDIVTDIDIAVELFLSNQLSKLIKNSNFIGEEIYSKNPSILNYYLSDEYCWTVDPIDGTNNFAKTNKRLNNFFVFGQSHHNCKSFFCFSKIICSIDRVYSPAVFIRQIIF